MTWVSFFANIPICLTILISGFTLLAIPVLISLGAIVLVILAEMITLQKTVEIFKSKFKSR